MSTNQRRSGGRNPLPEPVAGNGLLHRRALLGGGIAIAGAMGAGPSITAAAAEPLAVDPWTLEPGINSKAYELPSRFEKNTVRTLTIRTASRARSTRARRIICSTARSRRTACTSPSAMAASRTSIRTSTGW